MIFFSQFESLSGSSFLVERRLQGKDVGIIIMHNFVFSIKGASTCGIPDEVNSDHGLADRISNSVLL